jgi:hypothetical protein
MTRMETIHLETDLDAPVDAVWDAMQRPDTFLYVVRGLFSMPKLAGRTEPFVAGESGTGWLCALHVIPVDRHTIHVEVVDPTTHTIRTREHGGVLRTWNHTLRVEPLADGRSRYTDTVEIDAGRLTPVMARGATQIFRYRQRRWHRLVREGRVPTA